jgi:hypothetical protein
MPIRLLLTRRARGASAIVLASALLLAGCTTARHTSPHPTAGPVATAVLPPSSLCAPDQGDYVNQRADGTYTGCLRVPAVAASSVVVALQADVVGVTSRARPTTTQPPATRPMGRPNPLSLALDARTTTPGATVELRGRFARPTTTAQRRAAFTTLCWDGCDGLQEQGVTLHWSSPTVFHVALSVPDTAWLVVRAHRVTVHPLQSGRYRVAVQCVIATFGCGLAPPSASTTITLRAAPPTRCVPGRRCATMTLSATVARIGDRVLVRGWAPVQTIIGQPFGYTLSVAPGTSARRDTSLTFTGLAKGASRAVSVVLAPTTLRLVRGAAWADLGRPREVSWTFSGPSAVATTASSPRIGWCQPSGILITGGPTLERVATTDVATALRGSGLRGLERPGAPATCATVQLDPHDAASVYAGFTSEYGTSIPPVYLAPLYTTDAGATWHTVPIPAGASIESFGGFAVRGASVAALFDGPGGGTNRYPAGTSDGLVRTEVTSDGGARWTPSTLGCPANGPCVTFGPYPWGNCTMTNATQSLLLGPPGAASPVAVHWTSSSWIASVDSCYPQQLVTTSTNDLLLVDPSSQYPLQESTTAGRTWFDVALPPLAAANYGLDSMPTTNSLVLAPDGSLVAVVTAPSQQSQALYRLAPGASSWCRVPHVFGPSITTSGVAGPLRVNAADLAWSQTTYPNGAPAVTTDHVLALSDVRCRR